MFALNSAFLASAKRCTSSARGKLSCDAIFSVLLNSRSAHYDSHLDLAIEGTLSPHLSYLSMGGCRPTRGLVAAPMKSLMVVAKTSLDRHLAIMFGIDSETYPSASIHCRFRRMDETQSSDSKG